MYLQFHQLTAMPFENTPDPRFFFLSEDHREALANLVYAARSQKGLVLITGDIGMGKTTTSYFLESGLGKTTTLSVIRHAPSTPKQLLWTIADDLGLATRRTATRAELAKAIRCELYRQHEAGQTVLLMIDEAQALPVSVLDEVRLLTNIETATRKLCQVLLIGQSELIDVLAHRRLTALRQRIVLAHHIRPFDRNTTARYIKHRIRVASEATPRPCFTDPALDRLHEISGGVIRRINVIADKALLVASVRQTHRIDVDEVNEAAQPVTELFDGADASRPGNPMKKAA